MSAVSVLIVDDAYAAAALLPLSLGQQAALPDGTPLAWHIARSAAEAQGWLNSRQPDSLVLAVVDIDLGAASGALLIPQLRGSPALRGDACIVMWSSRDDGAQLARSAGADAFLSKQRMSRALAPGGDILAIVERLWQADVLHVPRPWIACG
jgi:CheY-like chemotaxis protein